MQTKIIITTILTISMKKKTYASLFVAFALSLTVQAQEWKAPQVPSEDLSSLKSTTTVYLYNVEADAFVTNGMDWNTNACATRLNKGVGAAPCLCLRFGSNGECASTIICREVHFVSKRKCLRHLR